jgi:hypothetical protein
MSHPLSRLACAALVGACSATTHDNAVFTVQSLPEYQPAQVTHVSVFGVYNDGRMNAEAWPRFAARLGFEGCDAAYGIPLKEADAEAYDAVTHYAMANGPDDLMLAPFDALAKGEVVLLLQVYGMPHAPRSAGSGSASATQGQSSAPPPSYGGGRGGGGMRGMRGMRGPTGSGTRGTRSDDDDALPFDMTASLYSPSKHSTVSIVKMHYSGHSLDEALEKFAEQLHAALPTATCGEWDWSAHADLARMHPTSISGPIVP